MHGHVRSHFSHVQLCVTLWAVFHQTPMSMGFSRQKSWNGMPCSPPGNHLNPQTETASLISPAFAGGFFTTSVTREANTPERSLIMEIIISFSISIRISGPKPEYLEWSLNTVLTQPQEGKCVCVCVCVCVCSVPRSCLAYPDLAYFPDKNTGVWCHFMLQETFPTQGSNLCLFHILHWQVDTLVPSQKLKEARGLLKFCPLGISLASFKTCSETQHCSNSRCLIAPCLHWIRITTGRWQPGNLVSNELLPRSYIHFYLKIIFKLSTIAKMDYSLNHLWPVPSSHSRPFMTFL